MMTAPAAPIVSVDEYLNTSWHPDKEYVDGVLIERSVPTIAHALLQVLLAAHFRALENEYSFKVLTEVRTEIVERARYRIPDIMLCPRPLPKGKVVNVTPLAVIEILSPDDKMRETLARFRDYARIGVPHIVQMDPEEYVAYRFERGSLIETRLAGLLLPGQNRSIPFDSQTLLDRLRAEHEEATASD